MLKVILAVLLSTVTFCEVKAESKVTFKDGKGVELSVSQALKASSNGEVVLRCQPVVATVNKSGTGISFKVVKK